MNLIEVNFILIKRVGEKKIFSEVLEVFKKLSSLKSSQVRELVNDYQMDTTLHYLNKVDLREKELGYLFGAT